MIAAQVVAHRRIEMVEVDEPRPERLPAGGLVIEPLISGVCGSDMPQFDRRRPADHYPLNPGMTIHECVGVVVQSRSPRFHEGDEVLALPRGNGALATRFVSEESLAVPVIPGQPHDQLVMAQPLGTVIWAMRKLGNLLGADTAVVGQGPNGLLITHMLANLGARRVIVMDRHDYRLAVSKQMLATQVVNSERCDAVEAIMDLTDGRGADLVVEAVGHQTETINQCLGMVRRGGTVLGFGVPDEPLYRINYSDLFRRNVHLIGSVIPEPQRDFPLAMEMIVQGRIRVAPLLTHRLPISEAHRGFDLVRCRREGVVKLLFEYPSARPSHDGAAA